MKKNRFQTLIRFCVGAMLVLTAAMVANSQSLGVYTDKMANLYPEHIGDYQLDRSKLKTIDGGDQMKAPATGNGTGYYKNPKTGKVLILGSINFATAEQAEQTLIGQRESIALSPQNGSPSKVGSKLIDGKVVGKRFTWNNAGSHIAWTNGSVYFHLRFAEPSKKHIDLAPLETKVNH